MKSAEELLNDTEKQKRLEEEAHILAVAKSLTNGHAGDDVLMGKAIEWLIKATIRQEAVIRAMVKQRSRWIVRIFGESFAVPITVGVCALGWLIFLFSRKHGWM